MVTTVPVRRLGAVEKARPASPRPVQKVSTTIRTVSHCTCVARSLRHVALERPERDQAIIARTTEASPGAAGGLRDLNVSELLSRGALLWSPWAGPIALRAGVNPEEPWTPPFSPRRPRPPGSSLTDISGSRADSGSLACFSLHISGPAMRETAQRHPAGTDTLRLAHSDRLHWLHHMPGQPTWRVPPLIKANSGGKRAPSLIAGTAPAPRVTVWM